MLTKADLHQSILASLPGVCILRGIPGSGKTRFADELMEFLRTKGRAVTILSPEQFPEAGDKFSERAAAACLRAYTMWVTSNLDSDLMIVDNTNLQVSCLSPYVSLAQAYGLPVGIVTMRTDPMSAFIRTSQYGIPLNRYRTMQTTMELAECNWPEGWLNTVQDTQPDLRSANCCYHCGAALSSTGGCTTSSCSHIHDAYPEC